MPGRNTTAIMTYEKIEPYLIMPSPLSAIGLSRLKISANRTRMIAAARIEPAQYHPDAFAPGHRDLTISPEAIRLIAQSPV